MASAIDTLERMYEAFSRGDVEDCLRHLHPDVEVRPLIGSVEGSSYRGRDEVREWMTEVIPEVWDGLQAHAEEFVEAGDAIVVLIRNVGRGASSGASVVQRRAHLVRMRDGLIAELTSYPSRAEAFQALGLDPDAAR